ncbi:FadR/GntR family transcriptional regulator [Brucella sp. NBRC 12950]|uniref:FadR/GntR family transcriptional regulator n=1 Tax=Brucella sp. NBRC 12950 TaxID=2994518 RepID=UPI0024A39378|nr:FadR/GntR family transcriptional regulator [Brucella sp. NBRC 12950]GLU29839.1 GntR family transcriptional regulator [Brucella sp. NBRC 12950]
METLTSRTISTLKRRIADGSIVKDSKLPRIEDLALEFGVSRTVIREAIAVLRSEGIVESKHGAGVFVLQPSAKPAPQTMEDALASVHTGASFMDLLELRMAFEVHAAGLAASRHSWAQEDTIWKSLSEFEKLRHDPAELDRLDYEFHKSIAEATNNTAFIEFFKLMSDQLMPQPAFSREINPALITDSYIDHTIVEHRAICDAISSRNVEQAREAMQAHLIRSHRRYRGFAGTPERALANKPADGE